MPVNGEKNGTDILIYYLPYLLVLDDRFVTCMILKRSLPIGFEPNRRRHLLNELFKGSEFYFAGAKSML